VLARYFHLAENQTTVRRELLGGLTTFMTMAYIVVVNPQILAQAGMPADGVLFATYNSAPMARERFFSARTTSIPQPSTNPKGLCCRSTRRTFRPA
jgi:xanthine/uracil/vitamin C permease (AzgA family)